jgi:hypothetical protein
MATTRRRIRRSGRRSRERWAKPRSRSRRVVSKRRLRGGSDQSEAIQDIKGELERERDLLCEEFEDAPGQIDSLVCVIKMLFNGHEIEDEDEDALDTLRSILTDGMRNCAINEVAHPARLDVAKQRLEYAKICDKSVYDELPHEINEYISELIKEFRYKTVLYPKVVRMGGTPRDAAIRYQAVSGVVEPEGLNIGKMILKQCFRYLLPGEGYDAVQREAKLQVLAYKLYPCPISFRLMGNTVSFPGCAEDAYREIVRLYVSKTILEALSPSHFEADISGYTQKLLKLYARVKEDERVAVPLFSGLLGEDIFTKTIDEFIYYGLIEAGLKSQVAIHVEVANHVKSEVDKWCTMGEGELVGPEDDGEEPARIKSNDADFPSAPPEVEPEPEPVMDWEGVPREPCLVDAPATNSNAAEEEELDT